MTQPLSLAGLIEEIERHNKSARDLNQAVDIWDYAKDGDRVLDQCLVFLRQREAELQAITPARPEQP